MKRQKFNLKQLSDEQLIDYYKKLKKRYMITNIASPFGGIAIGLSCRHSSIVFASALTAYAVLGGTFVSKTVSKLHKTKEELYDRDSTRRFLFEDLKNSKFSKRELKDYKEVLEKLIEYKEALNRKYSILDFENDVFLFKDNSKNLFENLKKNEDEKKSICVEVERIDKLIDDYLFLLSDYEDYLNSLNIPAVGVSSAPYKANIRVIHDDSVCRQKKLDASDFNDVLRVFDKSFETLKEKKQNSSNDETERF